MSPPRILIYLLRRDLRLHDNPIFHEIARLNSQSQKPFTHLLPLYVFPAQQVEVSGFLTSSDDKCPFPEARSQVAGFWRCGPHRTKFLAESVWDLKGSLQNVGSGLVVRVGMVGQVVQEVIDGFKKDGTGEVMGLWMTAEESVEEKREEREVRKVVEGEGKDFRLWLDEKYLIDDRDLPFKDPKELADVFTSFRKQVEPLRDAPRKTLSAPQSLPALPDSIPPQSPPFTIPDTLQGIITALHKPLSPTLDIDNPPTWPSGAKSAHPFTGGSKSGQERVVHLLATSSMSNYKDTRNGLLGEDFSTKLSAWLALGCITAREVHFNALAFEEGNDDLAADSSLKSAQSYGQGENQGTAAVRFELLWRDYMRLCTRKFGPRLFRRSGFRDDDSYPWKTPSPQDPGMQDTLNRFLNGTTGTSLIDASQRELLLTGYTSNRARQNVASFLAKHVGIDWRIGAEWYEACLVDYDVSSNWGNWQYVAGVGNDPRGSARVFNPVKQAFDYDAEGSYAKAWVEEVRNVEDLMGVFQPWTIPEEKRTELGLQGYIGAEKPLKKIDFRPAGSASKDRDGGRGGGAGRGKGRGWRGRGGYRGRGRGGSGDRGGRGRGRGGGTGQGRTGPNDKAQRFSESEGGGAVA